MSCLLNYTLQEQPELQHLAAEAELEHQQACRFHDTIFSSTTGCLKAWRLADQAEDTLWALSTVYSRALTDQVSPFLTAAAAVRIHKAALADQIVRWLPLSLPCSKATLQELLPQRTPLVTKL